MISANQRTQGNKGRKGISLAKLRSLDLCLCSKKQTGLVLINDVLLTFSGCVSYCKDTCDYDAYIATVYNVSNTV